MSGPDELTRLLQGAVADLPDTPDRVDRVALRVRMRRRQQVVVLASAAAVVAVLAAVAIPVAANRHTRPQPAGKAAGCALAGVTSITNSTPTAVPKGATSLTVCSYNFDGTRVWTRVLHTDVEQVAARLRGLPAAPANEVCDLVSRRNYGFTFRYPAGREVAFRLDLSGCGGFLDTALVQPTLRLLDDQRLSDAAGRKVRAPTCPPSPGPDGPRFDPLATPSSLVPTSERVVTACRYGVRSTVPGSELVLQAQAAGLTSALIAAVNASTGVPTPRCPMLTGGVDVLLFADQAQGVVEVRVGRTGCAAVLTRQRLVHASPALRLLLDGLLDRPGQQSVSTALPPCSTPLSAGTGAHPPVPAHPVLLRVCGNPAYDLDGATAEHYALLIAAAPVAPACTAIPSLISSGERRLLFVTGTSVIVVALVPRPCPRLATRDGFWTAPPEIVRKLGG